MRLDRESWRVRIKSSGRMALSPREALAAAPDGKRSTSHMLRKGHGVAGWTGAVVADAELAHPRNAISVSTASATSASCRGAIASTVVSSRTRLSRRQDDHASGHGDGREPAADLPLKHQRPMRRARNRDGDVTIRARQA